MTRGNNKLIIAAAGSGKTTHIVEKALEQADGRILITTFTEANETEIRRKIIKENKFLPKHITVETWFSFLLRHGARPFQGHLYSKNFKGLLLVNKESAPRIPATKIEKHYFSPMQKIYSDKLSKFVIECNKRSAGAVVDRLARIYTHIYIDEAQDLASYDLELLGLLFESPITMTVVGDPRQTVYLTHHAKRYKQYHDGKIKEFITDNYREQCEIDEVSLNKNYRSNSEICNLSNKLFPDHPQASSENHERTDHSGIFLIRKQDLEQYFQKHRPEIQLRLRKDVSILPNHQVRTFGDSKGLSFDRVLIYPTQNFIKWLKNNKSELKPKTRSQHYVGITRARHSVGIVCDFKNSDHFEGIEKYIPPAG